MLWENSAFASFLYSQLKTRVVTKQDAETELFYEFW